MQKALPKLRHALHGRGRRRDGPPRDDRDLRPGLLARPGSRLLYVRGRSPRRHRRGHAPRPGRRRDPRLGFGRLRRVPYAAPDEIIGGFRDAGNPADPHEYREINFYDLIKLGDSGNYLIQGQLQHQDIGSQSICFNVIYTPATQQKIFLPWKMFSWQYDAETGQLFGCYAADEYAASKGFTRDAQFYLYDIYTGECIKESGIIPNMFEAVMQVGTVYYIRKNYAEQKIIVDGKERGGRAIYTDTLCSYDFETGKQTVLLEDTDFDRIVFCGGRLLCRRNAHVGKDQLFYLDPADLSEELVYETPNKIENIWCCTNPDFILLRGTFVDGFLVNGELKRVQFNYY